MSDGALVICAAPGCDRPATWAVHPLPLEGAPRVLLVCDEHAAPLEPLEDPDRPRRGIG